jgi:hypothetical protein
VSRGVVYIVCGDKAEAALKRSIFSLKEFHPELDYEVRRLPPNSSPSRGLLEKSSTMDFSPFDETLFLDADTLLLDRLDFGFAQALRLELHAASVNVRGRAGTADYPRTTVWNTIPVCSSSRVTPHPCSRAGRLYQAWSTPRSILWAQTANRWSCRLTIRVVAKAMIRPAWHRTFFGPIKIWHDYHDPPQALRELSAAYRNPNAIIRFHWM